MLLQFTYVVVFGALWLLVYLPLDKKLILAVVTFYKLVPDPKLVYSSGGGFDQLLYQLIGIASVGGFTVAFSFIAWYAISLITGGIRVDAEEEFKGLDISEHGMEAYSGFSKESE